jgi:hypothetical protein
MSMWSWFNDAFDMGAAYRAASPAPRGAVFAKSPFPIVVAINAVPSRDEFTAWRDDSTTQFVMRALERNADECRDEWVRLSWEGGEADQRKLDGLRERSDALLGFTADYEAFCETLNLEPEQEDKAA